jgi:hypothetical protein
VGFSAADHHRTEIAPMKGLWLWLIGIPLPIIICLYLFGFVR